MGSPAATNLTKFVAVARGAGSRAEVEPLTQALDAVGTITPKVLEDMAFLFGTKAKGKPEEIIAGIAKKAPLGAAALTAKLGIGAPA